MTDTDAPDAHLHLSSYRRCIERIQATWPDFTATRAERLRQGLHGPPAEKVAENILEDLFTGVLDWDLGDVTLQVGRADMVLTQLGVKHLVVEVKRPGALAWHRRAVDAALGQARRYADEQKVGAVAVSDGRMFYAEDVVNGGTRPRIFVSLDGTEPPLDLWWVSVHGIYRLCPPPATELPPSAAGVGGGSAGADGEPVTGETLHHRYRLPARCFAYVGSAADPATWKLPYLLSDGSPDLKRLPKAVQAILSNFRGVRVSIPRDAVPDVLVRLGLAARAAGKLPCQCTTSAGAYVDMHHALDQLDRLAEVGCCSAG